MRIRCGRVWRCWVSMRGFFRVSKTALYNVLKVIDKVASVPAEGKLESAG